MDGDIARWVLDFLVRKPIHDSTLTALLGTLPLSDTDTNLKKHLLLKKIESEISNGSISENVLGLLEHIEELDYRDNIEVTESMKMAYSAVAVHCTVRFLENDDMGTYFEAVKKIWRNRIGVMLKYENVGLICDELIRWKDEIEMAVWDNSVCKILLENWKGLDVLEIVRVYVDEAKVKMGLSFLELVAETSSEDVLKQVFGIIDKEDIHKGNVLHRNKPTAAKQHKKFNSRTTRGVKIVDNDDPSLVSSHNKYGCMSPPEVTKLQEDLRTSTSSLRAVVKDPLPDALNIAKNVASNMDSVDRSAEKSNNKGTNRETNATKCSLMERNNTARTYEWDESIDGLADPVSRPHLPSPKERVVSPLKKYENPRPLRRKRRLWSNVEEDTLRKGVMKYGMGNWKLILNMYRDIFDDRTEVDLKDKWRNLTA